ncbi:MAG: cytochrome P450 [Pseudonocardiaceae bacterium]
MSTPTIHLPLPVHTGKGLGGVSRDFSSRPVELLTEIFQTHGDVAKVRFFANQYFYLVSHPDYVRHVFANNSGNYTKKPHPAFVLLSYVMGEGLVTSDGDLWTRQRKLIQPAFTKQRVAGYARLMTEATERMLHRWERKPGVFNVDADMMGLTLDIVGQTLFGLDITANGGRVGAAFTQVSEEFAKLLGHPLGPVLIKLPFVPRVRRFNASMRTLDDVVTGIITDRRQSATDRGDLLSLLMAARDDTGAGMDDQQLRDEVMTLLLSGHETTADALTWTFYLLAQHPEVLTRLEDEVDTVLSGRLPTVADLPALSYTKMVVQEALRLYPPIYLYARWGHQPDEIGGYHTPTDATITVCPYVVHRHPEFWDAPERFDPERFLPNAVAERHHYAWIPFSGGPRQCVGVHFALMEAQLLLATIVSRVRLRMAHCLPVRPSTAMTLRPSGGLPMIATARSS